jgi:hypothetical protein
MAPTRIHVDMVVVVIHGGFRWSVVVFGIIAVMIVVLTTGSSCWMCMQLLMRVVQAIRVKIHGGEEMNTFIVALSLSLTLFLFLEWQKVV